MHEFAFKAAMERAGAAMRVYDDDSDDDCLLSDRIGSSALTDVSSDICRIRFRLTTR
jgi:hypothetical protein